jgi:SAM-dependent methyltransferase
MSGFSDVDASGGVDRLISYLSATDSSLAAMKAYVAVAARRAVPGGVVLDLGCGIGHDLVRLGDVGVQPVGMDASAQMLERARWTAAGYRSSALTPPNFPLLTAHWMVAAPNGFSSTSMRPRLS